MKLAALLFVTPLGYRPWRGLRRVYILRGNLSQLVKALDIEETRALVTKELEGKTIDDEDLLI